MQYFIRNAVASAYNNRWCILSLYYKAGFYTPGHIATIMYIYYIIMYVHKS